MKVNNVLCAALHTFLNVLEGLATYLASSAARGSTGFLALLGIELMAPRTDRTTRSASGVASPVTTDHAAFVNLKNTGNSKIGPWVVGFGKLLGVFCRAGVHRLLGCVGFICRDDPCHLRRYRSQICIVFRGQDFPLPPFQALGLSVDGTGLPWA